MFVQRVAGTAGSSVAAAAPPVNPYAAPRESAEPEREALDDVQVKALADKLVKEKQDRTTSIQLLITGIIGCFSPILAVYGTIFLLLRPHSFPGKGMAVAGTVLHWGWTSLLVVMIVLAAVSP